MISAPGPSLGERFNEIHGPKSKVDCVVKKLSTIKSEKYLRLLLNSYVDENTKRGVVAPTASAMASPEYSEKVANKEAPQRVGLDYIITTGTVRVWGFLSEKLAKYKELPSDPHPKGWQEILAREWRMKRAKHEKKALHFVFSMDPRFSLALGRDRLPIDDILNAAVAETVVAYNHRYYPGKSLGWLSGLHHDRIHTHAHVLLYPATSDGKGISISDRNDTNIGGEEIEIDYHRTIHQSYDIAIKRQLELVRLRALADPAIRRATIVEFLAGHSLVVDTLKLENSDTKIDTTYSRWQKMMGANVDLGQLNLKRQSMADKMVVPSEAHFKDWLKPLDSVLAENEKLLAKMRASHRRSRKLSEELRRSPESFRPVIYSPGFPGESASGTKEHLRRIGMENVNKFVTPGSIRERLEQSVSRFDILVKKALDSRTIEPSVESIDTAIMEKNSWLSSYSFSNILEGIRKKNGLPPLAYEVDNFRKNSCFDLATARELLEETIRETIHHVGYINRTASQAELWAIHARRKVVNKLGRATTDLTELILPKDPLALPSVVNSANFIQFESLGDRIRSLSDMNDEQEKVMKRLQRIRHSTELDNALSAY